MRTRNRILAVLACAAVGLAPGLAHADDISNHLDGSVDAVAELMPLNVGGANGTTQLYLIPKNGDGKNGCNLTGGTTLKLSITSSNKAAATVSPSSVTFTSCADAPTLTVSPVALGSTTVTAAVAANTTTGTFNLAPVTFNVTVAPPPNTAPTVTIVDVDGGAIYHKGAVPVAMCQVTDAEDGPSQFPANLSAVTGPDAVDGIGNQIASCSFTDAGGLTARASVTYGIDDPTAPAVGHTLTPPAPDGQNGWYVSDVNLDWTVSEPESPHSLGRSGCDHQSIVADQIAQPYTCTATSAGGTGSDSVSIKRDATAPSVSLVGGPTNGASYLYNAVPAAPGCTATDATSGVDGACTVSGYSDAFGPHTVTATASDNAGNVGSASASYSVPTFDLKGFFDPVDMAGGIVNTVKNGSTVPLRFRVYDLGVEQVSTAVVKTFGVAKVGCAAGTSEDPVDFVTTGATSLRYDTTSGQFVQNWKTPTGAGNCYKVSLTTIDGSTLTALFKLK